VTLAAALAACILHYWSIRLRGPLSLERRAVWLQAACRRVMRAMGLRCRVSGTPPASGLVVSNHLSYADILIYGAVMPCFFVSKAEIAFWPFFGWAARTGGSLFIDRRRRASANLVAAGMTERLKLAVPVLLFPEGTSTDGSRVLRFHARLFAPAIAAGAGVVAAAIRYAIEGGEEQELCWYGDMAFLPHLWKVLGTRNFSAQIHFGEPRAHTTARIAAQAAHDEIAAMRAEFTWADAAASNV
jgi:lyso-ornithine lipid O-acyltransferase